MSRLDEMTDTPYITTKYSTAIEVTKSPQDAFRHLIDLARWWPEEFRGENIALSSEFVLTTGNGHYSKNKVIEFQTNEKVVWLVTESRRETDNFDWTGTTMNFELTAKGGKTIITFTYDGIVLESEIDRLAQICEYVMKEKLYNVVESFAATIELAKSSQEVFNCIKDVSHWWSKDFEGCSSQLHDEFIIHHPNAHYSKQKLAEVVPNKKIVWLVTESTLPWLQNDKHEWTNTKMIFEIIPNGNSTALHFTHEGLVPEKECYARCSQGWTQVITDQLFNYINHTKTI